MKNVAACSPAAASGAGAGGMIGLAEAMSIHQSSAAVPVIGADSVGGLVGILAGSSTVTESFATGNVSGADQVGGLVGELDDAVVENSYATGAVSGNDRVGGLIGLVADTDDSVQRSYAAGSVSGFSKLGGLVGERQAGTVAGNNFWDFETTGQSQSAGGTPETTVAMQTLATFKAAGWGIDPDPSTEVWTLCADRYPQLSWQGRGSVGVCALPPAPPEDIQVKPGFTSLLVSWRTPLDDGGSPIIGYVAFANPSCEVPAVPNEVPGVTQYSCELTGLNPSLSYSVFVSAINAVGEAERPAGAEIGEDGQPVPLSFSLLSALPVPVNNPWALLLLMLSIVGLVAGWSRSQQV